MTASPRGCQPDPTPAGNHSNHPNRVTEKWPQDYIIRQAEHHATRDIKSEFRLFLERHEIEYDEEPIWLRFLKPFAVHR